MLMLPCVALGQNDAVGQKPKVTAPKNIKAEQEATGRKVRKSTKPSTFRTPEYQKGVRANQSEIIKSTDLGDEEPASTKRAKAYDQNRRQTYTPKNNTEPSPATSKKNAKAVSKEISEYATGADSRELKKAKAYDKNRQLNYSQKNMTEPTPDGAKRSAKSVSSELSEYATGAESRELKKAKAYDKNRTININPKLNTHASREYRKAKAYDKSKTINLNSKIYTHSSREIRKAKAYDKNRTINLTQKLNTIPSPESQKAKAKALSDKMAAGEKLFATQTPENQESRMKAKSEKLSNSVAGNTMDRLAYRKMLKEKGRKLMAAEKGNTMGRTDYEKMVQRRSKKIAEATRGNTLAPEAHERLMKNKSENIATYSAGYLNTRAERRARLRSLIYPKDYQANSPAEVKEKARKQSDKIASFSGKRKRSYRRKVENAHPSSRAYSDRITLRSLDARGAAQRKGARQVAKNKKSYLPVFLRKNPEKSKYADVEKGIWYR